MNIEPYINFGFALLQYFFEQAIANIPIVLAIFITLTIIGATKRKRVNATLYERNKKYWMDLYKRQRFIVYAACFLYSAILIIGITPIPVKIWHIAAGWPILLWIAIYFVLWIRSQSPAKSNGFLLLMLLIYAYLFQGSNQDTVYQLPLTSMLGAGIQYFAYWINSSVGFQHKTEMYEKGEDNRKRLLHFNLAVLAQLLVGVVIIYLEVQGRTGAWYSHVPITAMFTVILVMSSYTIPRAKAMLSLLSTVAQKSASLEQQWSSMTTYAAQVSNASPQAVGGNLNTLQGKVAGSKSALDQVGQKVLMIDYIRNFRIAMLTWILIFLSIATTNLFLNFLSIPSFIVVCSLPLLFFFFYYRKRRKEAPIIAELKAIWIQLEALFQELQIKDVAIRKRGKLLLDWVTGDFDLDQLIQGTKKEETKVPQNPESQVTPTADNEPPPQKKRKKILFGKK